MSLSAMPLILRCTKTDHDRSSHDISALSGSASGLWRRAASCRRSHQSRGISQLPQRQRRA